MVLCGQGHTNTKSSTTVHMMLSKIVNRRYQSASPTKYLDMITLIYSMEMHVPDMLHLQSSLTTTVKTQTFEMMQK